MKPLGFDDLARLPVIQFYETAFRKATGVSLKVFPPGEPKTRLSFGGHEDPFCALASGTSVGCAECLTVQTRAQRGASKRLRPQQINCYAGLTEVAVPVVIGGRHVATLMSGQVFRREPTERDFKMSCRCSPAVKTTTGRKKRARLTSKRRSSTRNGLRPSSNC